MYLMRRYTGDDIRSILQRIKKELGESAIVFSINKKGLLKPKYEVVAGGIQSPSRVQTQIQSRNEVQSQTQPKVQTPKQMQGQIRRQKLEMEDPDYKLKTEILQSEIKDIKELLRYLLRRVSTHEEMKLSATARKYYSKMASKGVERSLALSIIEDAVSYGELNEKTLKSSISHYLRFSKNILGNGRKFIAFVGPTGVGKTTTVAKVAAEASLKRRLKTVILTTDTYRIGAVEQIKKYADIMKVPVFVSPTPDSIQKISNQLKNFDVVLIDTVGRSHYDCENIKRIKNVLSSINEKMETILLISSSQAENEIIQVIKGFSIILITSTSFTKIDETSSPGVILNVSSFIEKEISYYTTGQKVPEDITTADVDSTYNLIFG